MTKRMPWTERSLELKRARKVKKRSKRDLQGLHEAPNTGSVATGISATTSVSKEPGVQEVRVWNSDIAEFVTKAEINTKLWQYAQRRSRTYDTITKDKISFHMRNLKTKTGVTQRFAISSQITLLGISSTNSNISKSMAARKPTTPLPLSPPEK